MSDELKQVAPLLTGRQWAGVVRIIRAELEGRSATSLLEGRDKICARTTYYGRWAKGKDRKSQRGWLDNPHFTQALEWARRDYRTWLMEHGAGEAMAELGRVAQPAAHELGRQVTGDLVAIESLSAELDKAVADGAAARVAALASALGETGLSAALSALQRALEQPWEDEAIYRVLVAAMARIASPLYPDRQKAAIAVLDRLPETASKGAVAGTIAVTLVGVDPDGDQD